MTAKKSIKTRDFRKVLTSMGLVKKRTKGSHEAWSRPGLLRPVIFQATKKIVPQHILMNNLKILKISFEEFIQKLNDL